MPLVPAGQLTGVMATGAGNVVAELGAAPDFGTTAEPYVAAELGALFV